MKKFMTLLLLVTGVLFLSGCDLFEDGITNIWYDEMNETINISYSLDRPFKDEDTGEYPEEHIFLIAKHRDSDIWEEIVELAEYSAEDLQISYRFEDYGDYELKVIRKDAEGNIIEESLILNIYINMPQYIYHFDAWFDSWSGEVIFNFGLEQNNVSSISILKSQDGGLTWEQVVNQEIEYDEFGNIQYELKYYEYIEGNYSFKLEAYDVEGILLSELNTWGEIKILFENKVFEGTPEIWWVGSNVDTYSRNVNIWWDSSGAFDGFLIEKSTDNENWEYVGEVPRIAQSFNYIENVDGEYYYRVSLILAEETVETYISADLVRVRDGALLGHLDGWIEWDLQNINLNWDFYSEEVTMIRLERSFNQEDFTLVGEFGALKKMHTDESLLPGTYVYKVSLLNDLGEVLDSMNTKEFVIESMVHVYSLNAWHNQQTGEVEFNFGINQYYVKTYMIEKSADGGLTWENIYEGTVELIENDWYIEYVRLYELTEGAYSYRFTGYDDNGTNVGTVNSWNEVVVRYDNLNYDEPTEIYNLDANYNVWDNSVNLWWGSQGGYDRHVVEKSTDGTVWELVMELPRISTYVQLIDLADGEYYFRISAVDVDGVVLHSREMNYKVRVKEDAQIGSFYVYYEWYQQEVNLNWDIINDNVSMIVIERKLVEDDSFTLLGEYGSLKTTLFDSPDVNGTYIYRITLFDVDSTVLDQLESQEVIIEVITE